VFVGRIITGLLMLAAAGVTFVLTSAQQSFNLLMSIGAGTGLIYLLRWFWWRINAWSEIAAMASSFIVSIAFFVAQKAGATIDATTVLLVTIIVTTVSWVVATYLTEPTDAVTLERFYALVRPPGPGWREVRERGGLGPSPDSLAQSLLAWVAGCTFVYAALFGSGSLLYGRLAQGAIWIVLFVASGIYLVRLLPRLWSRSDGTAEKAMSSAPTKAVILARGLGTRMRVADDRAQLSREQAAVADTGLKAMIAIDRPFLDYVLSALADAGFTEACLVIGPEHGVVREYYEKNPPSRVRVNFAIQEKPLGTADALLAASGFIGEDAFVVLNADNYYPPEVLRLLRAEREPALPAFERGALIRDGNIPPERIARYALLDVDDDGYLRRVVEKPDAETERAFGPDAAVSMNVWLLTPAILEACRRVAPSARSEVELPNAIQWAIEHLGMRLRALPVRAAVLDLSHRGDIPEVTARLRGVPVRL
jgi:glucose-1-phosphate thymidylyltransferase